MKLIFGIILGALGVIFAVQNPQMVSYQFLAWSFSAPRALVLIVVLVAGVCIGWLLSTIRRWSRQRTHVDDSRKQDSVA